MAAATPSDDDRRLAELGGVLVDAVDHALEPWARRSVADRLPAGAEVEPARLEAAVAEIRRLVVPPLGRLLAADVDEQRQAPLALVRGAVGPLTQLLREAGAAPAHRDDHQRALFPDDEFDLVPASFADLSDEVGQAGIAWGAAKAFVHRRRHRG